MSQNLSQIYQQKIDQGSINDDPIQRQVINSLEKLKSVVLSRKEKKLLNFFKKAPTGKQGLYIYGGVGRGKSMLMDLFYDHMPIKEKRRVHFHEFIIDLHNFLHSQRKASDNKGVEDILPRYAAKLAKEVKLLCFDEFHVSDIADAMILSRLFTALFDAGIYVVATSNIPPKNLYKDGLQRESFLPFIDILERHVDVLFLDSPTDYRKQALLDNPVYFYPLGRSTDDKLDQLYKTLTNGQEPSYQILDVKGRKLSVCATANGIARFTFAELCEKPLGSEDYLLIAQTYQTVFIEKIPALRYDRRNEAKRFILLIDALYEARTRVVFSADTSAEKLYFGNDHGFEFDRTVSRLIEMQSTKYLIKD